MLRLQTLVGGFFVQIQDPTYGDQLFKMHCYFRKEMWLNLNLSIADIACDFLLYLTWINSKFIWYVAISLQKLYCNALQLSVTLIDNSITFILIISTDVFDCLALKTSLPNKSTCVISRINCIGQVQFRQYILHYIF